MYPFFNFYRLLLKKENLVTLFLRYSGWDSNPIPVGDMSPANSSFYNNIDKSFGISEIIQIYSGK